MINKQSYLYWPTLFTVTVFFTFALVNKKTIDFCFYLVVLYSLISIVAQPNSARTFGAYCRLYWPLLVAMSGSVLAVFIGQLARGSLIGHMYDVPSKLALFFLVFWLFMQFPATKLQWIKWGWIIGVIICAILLAIKPLNFDGRPDGMLVWYVELTVLMGIFSLLSIVWTQTKNILAIGLQFVAGFCGLYTAYIAQTRGIWMAFPVFVLIMATTLKQHWFQVKYLIYFASLIIILIIAFCSSPNATKRIGEIKQDITLYNDQVNPDTSIGNRLQLWQASWQIFKENPVFGVGRENYSSTMQKLADQNTITPFAATFYHSHNEFLYNMMTSGIFGLFGLLLTYTVPGYYFARELRDADQSIRAAAAMGLCLVTGFFIFGLVDVMFMYKVTDIFYCFSIALFLAYIAKRKQQLSLFRA